MLIVYTFYHQICWFCFFISKELPVIVV